MALVLNLLLSALSGGGRTARYGDLILVTMPAQAFATTAMEYQQAQVWARARSSLGNVHRDREAFIGRFQTVLARSGGGIATRGARPVLARILAGMTQSGMQSGEWSVPHDINDSVEVKRRKPGRTGETPVDPAQVSEAKVQEPSPVMNKPDLEDCNRERHLPGDPDSPRT